MATAETDATSSNTDWKDKVFDSLSFPTLILRPDMSIVAANEVFLKKYDVRREEVIGKKCHEIFYRTSRSCSPTVCPLSRVRSTRKGHSILKRLVGPDNQERWEDRVFSPILDDDGNLAYILESVRDITRLKTMEKEIEVTRGFLEKVIQSSASAIIAADVKGKVLLMNPAAEELFGYSADEAVGRNIVEYFYSPGTARDIMRKMRSEDGGKGKLPITKMVIINGRGEHIPVEMTGSIIYDGDREVATMGIYNDLREKNAVELKLEEARARLVQSEKMASLGQLAAGVAHEINNPLAGIVLYANLAMEQMGKEKPLYEYLQYVIEDANRCRDIVKNLLAYSRQTNPDKTIIHLNALLEQSLALIRDQALLQNIRVEKFLAEGMMLVKVDTNQMGQVIINLVMNAVDAMNGRGVLTFRTYRNKLDLQVYLEVEDTGGGIPQENLVKIFDPFFTTKEPGKGTGLGLSTSYGIVEENGGRITVKSTGPEGTTFLITLPLYQVSSELPIG